MVATRRHWVHLQILEERRKKKEKRRRRLRGREGMVWPELKLTSADRMWSEEKSLLIKSQTDLKVWFQLTFSDNKLNSCGWGEVWHAGIGGRVLEETFEKFASNFCNRFKIKLRLMRALWRRQCYQTFDFYFVLQLAPTEITTYHDFLKYFQKSDADSPRERRGIETVLPWTHREPEDVTFNHISDFFERFVIEINFGRTFSVSSEMPGRSLAVRTLLPRFQ